MIDEMDISFHPSGYFTAPNAGKKPPHDLWFSCGSPLYPMQLCSRQQRCMYLTVRTRLFESPKPSTHYWFSRDMEWWFSVAKQVLDDVHLLLTRQSSADKARLYEVFLRGDWVRGPWNSDTTWLSRFIHRYYAVEGTVLYPFRNKVDKHLKDLPDTLRFDVFLLQCWSQMALASEQKRTFEIIYEMNDEAMETCMEIIQARLANRGCEDQSSARDPSLTSDIPQTALDQKSGRIPR